MSQSTPLQKMVESKVPFFFKESPIQDKTFVNVIQTPALRLGFCLVDRFLL